MACDGSCIGEAHSGLAEYCSLSVPPSPGANGHKSGKSWLVKLMEPDTNTVLGKVRIKYVEGSGISRKNRLSCESMVKILIKFLPYHALMKKDDKGFYKTGTLSGIRTRAGYIKGRDQSLYPYVIMINIENKDYKNILEKMEKKVRSL